MAKDEMAWFERPTMTFTELGRRLGEDPRTLEARAEKLMLEVVDTGKKRLVTTASVLRMYERLEAPVTRAHGSSWAAAGRARDEAHYVSTIECPHCAAFLSCHACGWNGPGHAKMAAHVGETPNPTPAVYRYGQALADAMPDRDSLTSEYDADREDDDELHHDDVHPAYPEEDGSSD